MQKKYIQNEYVMIYNLILEIFWLCSQFSKLEMVEESLYLEEKILIPSILNLITPEILVIFRSSNIE